MQIGVQSAFHSKSIDLSKFAARCEELGFESFWMPEHTAIPANPSVGQPLGRTSGPRGTPGEEIPDSYLLMVDPLIGLTMVAAATNKMGLGTGVCLVPEHHPIDLAKRISSLDLYSNGRFILGVGAGWQPEEMTAMGGDFKHRWTQTKECIEVMKKLWTKDEAEHTGNYYQFPALKFHPKPVQKPHPPILLGGMSKRVFKRIAEWADGWVPIRVSPDELATGRQELNNECERINRDPKTTTITMFSDTSNPWKVKDYAEAGADRVVFTVPSTSDEDPFGQVEAIAKSEGLIN